MRFNTKRKKETVCPLIEKSSSLTNVIKPASNTKFNITANQRSFMMTVDSTFPNITNTSVDYTN